MSKNIIRDYVKNAKRVNGDKYIANSCTYPDKLSPSQYGGFLDKKRTTTRRGK